MHHVLHLRLLQPTVQTHFHRLHDRRHNGIVPLLLLRLQHVCERAGVRLFGVAAVDVHEFEDHIDAVAAELVEPRFVGRAVHRDAQLAVRVEEIHLVHVAALRKRVEEILHVGSTRKDALDALAYPVENRVVVYGGAADVGGDVHIQICQLFRNQGLYKLLVG